MRTGPAAGVAAPHAPRLAADKPEAHQSAARQGGKPLPAVTAVDRPTRGKGQDRPLGAVLGVDMRQLVERPDDRLEVMRGRFVRQEVTEDFVQRPKGRSGKRPQDSTSA